MATRKPNQVLRFFERENTIVISMRSLGEKPKPTDFFKFVVDDLRVDPSDVVGFQLLTTKDLGFIKIVLDAEDAYTSALGELERTEGCGRVASTRTLWVVPVTSTSLRSRSRMLPWKMIKVSLDM